MLDGHLAFQVEGRGGSKDFLQMILSEYIQSVLSLEVFGQIKISYVMIRW